MHEFPSEIHRYRRDRLLGRGGMGVVYRYFDPELNRHVAVKALPREYADRVEWRERFRREARALARLHHPNIAAIHDIVEHEDDVYLVLEFVAGRTLALELGAGPLPIERTLSTCRQIAEAIRCGHEAGVVHRDIKPANIMVTLDGRAKLLDFGLARSRDLWLHAKQILESVLERPADERESAIAAACAGDVQLRRIVTELLTEASDDEATVDTAPPAFAKSSRSESTVAPLEDAPTRRWWVTERGRIVGTPGYLSPEQARGEAVNPATDVWGLGCVLYECLAGVPAFPVHGPEDALRSVLDVEPNFDSLHAPAELIDLTRRCLAKRAEQRPSSITEVCATLVRIDDEFRRPAPVVHDLPAELTSYVPRPGEIDRVLELLERARLVTITGPGGSGKTRLALEVLRRVVELSRHDEVRWIELAALDDTDLIAPTMLAALSDNDVSGHSGLEPTHGDPVARICRHWNERPVILALDNCEHVLTGCRSVVHEILRRCPNVRVVLTSRQSVGLPGEQTYSVPELSTPKPRLADGRTDPLPRPIDLEQYEATKLFVERARLVQPELDLDAERSAAVVKVCRQLEGIPLAIELAAACTKSIGLVAIADRLLEVIDGDHLLESSITWSVESLTPEERDLLGRLAVFRHGWTLESAEAICSVADSPLVPHLAALVDKSLVRYDEPRYRMLETVREYCARRLTTPERSEESRRRHLEYFVDFVTRVRRTKYAADQAGWIDRADEELANIRAALEYSSRSETTGEACAQIAHSMAGFWDVRFHVAEARRWLDTALAQPRLDRRLRVRLLNSAAVLSQRHGDDAAAHRFLSEALERLGDDDELTRAALLTNLGNLALQREDFSASREFSLEAIAIYERLDDAHVATPTINLGVLEKCQGNHRRALELLDRGWKTLRTAHRERSQTAVIALRNMGEVSYHDEVWDRAALYLRDALSLAIELGDGRETPRALLWLGLTLAARKQHRTATRLLAAADAAFDHSGAPANQVERRLRDRCVATLSPRPTFDLDWSAGSDSSPGETLAVVARELDQRDAR